jgi:hypothetical protein
VLRQDLIEQLADRATCFDDRAPVIHVAREAGVRESGWN